MADAGALTDYESDLNLKAIDNGPKMVTMDRDNTKAVSYTHLTLPTRFAV